MSSLLENFTLIESALLYHHSLVSTPLLVSDLLKSIRRTTGAVVVPQDLEALSKIDSSLYKISGSGPQQRIEAPEIMKTHNERRSRILQIFATSTQGQAVKSSVSVTDPLKQLFNLQVRSQSGYNDNEARPQATATLVKPIEVLRGRRRITGSSKSAISTLPSLESIRQRVIQKQNQPRPVYNLKGSFARRRFVEAQIPLVFEQLCLLRQQGTSFSLSEVISRLENSLSARLSKQEILQTVELVAERVPMLCQIVTGCGGLRAIKFLEWSNEKMTSARTALALSQPLATKAY